MQGEEKRRTQTTDTTQFSATHFTLWGLNGSLFFFKEIKKVEKEKYQKHWPHLRYPYPCLGTVLILVENRNFLFPEKKGEGKISRKKTNGENTYISSDDRVPTLTLSFLCRCGEHACLHVSIQPRTQCPHLFTLHFIPWEGDSHWTCS